MDSACAVIATIFSKKYYSNTPFSSRFSSPLFINNDQAILAFVSCFTSLKVRPLAFQSVACYYARRTRVH